MKKIIEEILVKNNIPHEFIPLPEDLPMDVESLMEFHGKGLRFAMPNMVFKTEKGIAVVIRRGDTQIDNRKLRDLLGAKSLSLAGVEEMEKLGLKPGIVPPLGYDLPIFIDKKVLDNQEVYTGTGDKLFDLKINPHDLIKINHAQVADFTKLKDSQAGGRVLSGIRATGRLHLGNYLGAVKGMLELQNNPDYETFYMVADIHTITTPYNVEELKKNRREVIIDYLAAGLDPEKSVIFQQAEVPEHTELAFYFSSVVTIARMQHLPTFKEKVKQHPDSATMALLNYPILMAADILIYKAGLVPVGIDQEPHLEVARVIANNMNAQYGTDFPEPVRFATKGEYVPSLTGEGKMSKTVEGSFINITDDLETIKSKVAKLPTDSGKGEFGENGPERGTSIHTVLSFVELFFGKEKVEEYKKAYLGEGIRYGDLKKELAEAIYEELRPLQEKRKELENDPEYVDKVIKEGAEKARAVAQETLKEVKEKMGLRS